MDIYSEKFLSTPSARRATAADRPRIQDRQFLSTPSARRATSGRRADRGHQRISIHALREEGDPARPAESHDQRISIHALREEGDLLRPQPLRLRRNFYPRPPRGGRRCGLDWNVSIYQFLSTPSARRATVADSVRQAQRAISIHALREEGDPLKSVVALTVVISIHALREEGDVLLFIMQDERGIISIHALREEGDPV